MLQNRFCFDQWRSGTGYIRTFDIPIRSLQSSDAAYRFFVAVYAVKALNSIQNIRSNCYFRYLATLAVNIRISG